MPIPDPLGKHLALPVIGAPMFLVSNPDLVVAQCRNGVIGAFPALNARPESQLDEWLTQITGELVNAPAAAPFAVNQIIHQSNARLEHDLTLCVKHRVPLIITSLRAPNDIVKYVHAYGGLVFHDVISVRHAEKALEAGVDGLILVCAGAGGHGGNLSPFALVREVRKLYAGPIALSGAITCGSAILAAQAMGADFAYMGTRFLATREAHVSPTYQQTLLAAKAADIVNTPYFSGVPGNYLRQSIVAAGLDPDQLPERDKSAMDFGNTAGIKAWRDILSAGQGVGDIDEILSVANLVDRLKQEYTAAKACLCTA
ncbi:MAG: nitronate monooxygenase family protein [Pseudomonadota bacterium]